MSRLDRISTTGMIFAFLFGILSFCDSAFTPKTTDNFIILSALWIFTAVSHFILGLRKHREIQTCSRVEDEYVKKLQDERMSFMSIVVLSIAYLVWSSLMYF